MLCCGDTAPGQPYLRHVAGRAVERAWRCVGRPHHGTLKSKLAPNARPISRSRGWSRRSQPPSGSAATAGPRSGCGALGRAVKRAMQRNSYLLGRSKSRHRGSLMVSLLLVAAGALLIAFLLHGGLAGTSSSWVKEILALAALLLVVLVPGVFVFIRLRAAIEQSHCFPTAPELSTLVFPPQSLQDEERAQ